jgi:Signal peptidase (SPase) II
LAVAGWASNLLDRLGMHYVTAPGSTRGAVDFLPFAGHYWNLADAAIVTGTAGLLVAMSVAVFAHPVRTARVRVTRDLLGSRWAPAVVGAGVTASVVLATIGAVDYGTLSGPA